MIKKQIGLITGTFDLLHVGHRDVLTQAMTKVDELMVGVESDKRVRMAKGKGRPVQGEKVRVEQVQNFLPGVKVEILPEDFGREKVREAWLRERGIAVLLTTADDKFLDNKKKMMKKIDGGVMILKKRLPVSTTQILMKRKEKYGKT